MIITKNVTWARVPLSCPPTARSTPSVKVEGRDPGRNREISSFGGDTKLGDDESESSGREVEMVTSKADDTETENTALVQGRSVLSTSRAGSSVYSEWSRLEVCCTAALGK